MVEASGLGLGGVGVVRCLRQQQGHGVRRGRVPPDVAVGDAAVEAAEAVAHEHARLGRLAVADGSDGVNLTGAQVVVAEHLAALADGVQPAVDRLQVRRQQSPVAVRVAAEIEELAGLEVVRQEVPARALDLRWPMGRGAGAVEPALVLEDLRMDLALDVVLPDVLLLPAPTGDVDQVLDGAGPRVEPVELRVVLGRVRADAEVRPPVAGGDDAFPLAVHEILRQLVAGAAHMRPGQRLLIGRRHESGLGEGGHGERQAGRHQPPQDGRCPADR